INTAIPGASVDATRVDNSGTTGESVAAGTLTVQNSTSAPATLRSVTIAVSDPGLMSSMTLKAGSQSVTESTVCTATAFNFQSPVTIAANSKLTMKLSAVMAQIQQTALATKWARLAAALGGGRARKEAESVRRLRAALAFVALTICLALLTAGT